MGCLAHVHYPQHHKRWSHSMHLVMVFVAGPWDFHQLTDVLQDFRPLLPTRLQRGDKVVVGQG